MAADAAQVVLKSCIRTDNQFGCGAQTKAKLMANDCTASSFNRTGFSVLSGACAVAVFKKCNATKNSIHGVYAADEGSRLEAQECTLQKNVHCGVMAAGAAEVLMRGCDSTDNGSDGIVAEPKAKLTAEDCSASFCKGTGFSVHSGACVALQKCTAARKSIHGVYAADKGSRLEAQGCTLEQNAHCGAMSASTAEEVVSGCHSTDNGKNGFLAQSQSTIAANDCSASMCKGTGFAVFGGARAVLDKCTAAKNRIHGVFAGGEESRLEAEGCTIERNVQSGVFASEAQREWLEPTTATTMEWMVCGPRARPR